MPHNLKPLSILCRENGKPVVTSALALPGFVPGTFYMELWNLDQVYRKPQLVNCSVCSGRDSSSVPPEYKSEPLTFCQLDCLLGTV
jgi:hypothetical protein